VRDVEFLRRRITFSENAVQIGARHAVGPTKGRKARSVPVLVFVLDALSAQCRDKAPADLMFSSRDQIQAVEPLLNSPAGAGTPDDTHDRVHTIITSALDSLLRAEALTAEEDHDDDRSILGDLLLFRHFDTRGARWLRVVYYFSLIWLTFNIWVCVQLAFEEHDAAERISGAGFALVVGVAPLVVIRSWALRHERRHTPTAPIQAKDAVAGTASAQPPSE
jgi:hypothetical protein